MHTSFRTITNSEMNDAAFKATTFDAPNVTIVEQGEVLDRSDAKFWVNAMNVNANGSFPTASFTNVRSAVAFAMSVAYAFATPSSVDGMLPVLFHHDPLNGVVGNVPASEWSIVDCVGDGDEFLRSAVAFSSDDRDDVELFSCRPTRKEVELHHRIEQSEKNTSSLAHELRTMQREREVLRIDRHGTTRYLVMGNSYGEGIATIAIPSTLSDSDARSVASFYPSGTPNRREMIRLALATYAEAIR